MTTISPAKRREIMNAYKANAKSTHDRGDMPIAHQNARQYFALATRAEAAAAPKWLKALDRY